MNKRSLNGYAAAGAIIALALAMPLPAFAGVDINISVPFFGLFTYEPQPVVVAPSPYGYAPNGYAMQPAGAVFYSGYWYLPSGGNWFIAAQVGGPWAVIGMERVPYAVLSGPVLMERPRMYYGVLEGPAVGIAINPWITIGERGGGHHGRGHDD
jgi:hypothetical protein